MPFSFGKKHKDLGTSPEISTSSRPLFSGRVDVEPSVTKPKFTPATINSYPSSYVPKHSEATDVYSTATSVTPSSEEKVGDEPSSEFLAEEPTEIERPLTPPQGSNHQPWESYHDLPPDHPVFRIPAAEREKMYAKGIDPVVRAEMDKSIRGKVYGKKPNVVKGFKGRATGMIRQFGSKGVGYWTPTLQ